jgi:intein/homing endonuclease
MPVQEKITQEDLALFEIIKNPVLFPEFIYNLDSDPRFDTVFELTWYQRNMLGDFNPRVSICTARATGKCLEESSRIMNPSTGEYKTVKDWFIDGNLDSVVTIDDDWKSRKSTCRIQPNGIHDCLEITAVGGYKTTVTFEHPILTNVGFVIASELKVGDFIACGKSIPFFGKDLSLSDSQIKILAHFIAEGTFHSGSITTTDSVVISDIYEYADTLDYTVTVEDISYHIVKSKSERRNLYLSLLSKHGLREKHSYDKFIPQAVFKLPKKKLGLFLNRLFSDDGWCMDSVGHSHIGYASTSEQLIRDIRHLLLRFGIHSSIVFKKNRCLGSWNLTITGKDSLEIFRDTVGFCISYKNDKLNSAIKQSNAFQNQADILPIPNFKDYRTSRKDESWSRALNYYPSRIKATGVENKDSTFTRFENADIYWSKIKTITVVEDRETYAVEVDKYNTHLVDDIWSHNTVADYSIILWLLIYNLFPDDYVLFTVPSKVHLEPVFTNLVRLMKTNSFLKNFIDAKSGVNSSEFKITLKNGAVLLCRIAGQSGTGSNLIALHTPLIIVDEGGYFPYNAFNEMQPSLNVWTPGHREIVSGVPTGMRENNVLYTVDQENDAYTKHRVSAFDNPRITAEDIQAAREQYGGDESEDFIHYVLGQHGKPVYSLFDRSLLRVETYPVFKLNIDGLKFDDVGELLAKIEAFPNILEQNYGIVVGIDLGYTEPTAISIMYLDGKERLRIHGRIKLTKVSYPIQEKILDLIDTKYKPLILGVDKGSAGVSVIQTLQEHPEYRHKNYKNRLYPVDFSSSIVLGENSDGTENKVKAKPFFVSVLQEMCNSHRLIFSSTDLEMVTELERMTYSKGPSGEITYKTITERGGKRGEDHFTSSLLCGVGAFHMTREFASAAPKIRLMRAMWN